MDADHLSKRLATVASYAPQQARLADIGSDHAYLPVWLAKQNRLAYGVAGEVVAGPLHNAETTIAEANLTTVIDARLGDGLAVIKPEDALDTIVIAGMGGTLISDILTRGWQKLTGKELLILQPNVGEEHLRGWLVEHQYEITAENILKDDGHVYEIIVAKKATAPVKLSHADLMFGPFLRVAGGDAFIEKWQHEAQRTQHVLDSLQQAAVEPSQREADFTAKLAMIKEALADAGTTIN
ncbi:tRNA (adenine(22)-N(1))-methyltransferase [Furfurilactobacillus siliginis]|nr:tRNA (adenine(22)-N(1))-methyltransferase TrmK [Furfurilactobacillus siliginis]GEK27796.1 SAM-dependent methyltransferase [Furfurilactobacillus siliginis]